MHAKPAPRYTPSQCTYLNVLVYHPLGHGLGLLGFRVAQKPIQLRKTLYTPTSRLGRLWCDQNGLLRGGCPWSCEEVLTKYVNWLAVTGYRWILSCVIYTKTITH